MTRWRLSLALLLALFVALPLVYPFRELVALTDLPSADTLARIAVLLRNTVLLVVGVLVCTLPVGITLAFLLERTDLPYRRLFRALLIVALFIPLPLLISGWQVVQDWLPSTEWSPWSMGLPASIWLHSLAGLPWVTLLAGVGLRSVEREFEEDALLIRPPAWVLIHVTLRRALPALAATGLWLAVQTAGEIMVTDLMQVRTIAEEVYTQLVTPELGETLPIGRAVAASLILVILSVGSVLILARHAPRGTLGYRPTYVYHLRYSRSLISLFIACLVVPLVLVPTLGLLWRAGLTGLPPSWSLASFVRQLNATTRSDAWLLLRSPLVAIISGVLCATLALVACWLARESRWFRVFLLLLLTTAWAMPGPLVGFALKELFRTILDITDRYTLLPASILWHGPSSLPLVIVNLIRLLPFAAAILWPAILALPKELHEAARLDGATPTRELVAIVFPLTRAAYVRAVLGVAVLSLGELSAGKIVSTPQAESFAEVIWTQMHYGLGADLAAKSVLLLGGVVLGVSAMMGAGWGRSGLPNRT